ncbi:hypothetical protein P3L10_023694 [Capsicum annuum]
MCRQKETFSELDETFQDIVRFKDNLVVSAQEKGKIKISTKKNSIHTIGDVFYDPALKTNLLSVGQLQENVYELNIKGGVCKIRDPRLGLIAQVNMHLNFGSLKFLKQKQLVLGLPQLESPDEVCEECVVSTQHREPFLIGKSWTAKKVLELVHSDIYRLISPTSNGDKRCFISFIDDYSRNKWVYFLREKSEAFETFKKFKVFVENEVGCQIKCLQTDWGGEYNSLEFVEFCEKHEIKRHLTATYTPQQNGVCERKNRIILDMIRSLLKRCGLPRDFWAEAVH